MNRLKLFIILFLFIAVSSTATEIGIVKRITDGDTIVVIINGAVVKVRIIGIETPESKKNDKVLRDSGRSGKYLDTIIARGLQANAFIIF